MSRIPQEQIKQMVQLALSKPNQPFSRGNWSADYRPSMSGETGSLSLYHYDTLVCWFIPSTKEFVLTRGAYSVSDRDGINSMLAVVGEYPRVRVSMVNGRLMVMRA